LTLTEKALSAADLLWNGKAIFSMSDARSVARSTGNLFLDNMPTSAMNALRRSLAPVTLTNGEVICDNGQPINSVLFPVGSVISVVLQMSDGDTAEVGIVGRDGMTGLAIALGQSSTSQRSLVQIPDGALSVPADDFRAAVEHDVDLKTFCLHYAQAVLMSSMQMSACNSLHPTNERCARWLLMAHDRVGENLVRLTQEFLSQMLGVRRASVVVAASALQTAGFISYSRGQISVLNRAGLESASCECYETMEREWKKLMGYGMRKSASNGALRASDASHADGTVR
jgi:CRP-like cAMP-binding protein